MTTIAGVAFRLLDRLPREGDKVSQEGFGIKILQMEGQRIARVRVSRGEEQVDEPDDMSPPAEDAAESQLPGEADTPGQSNESNEAGAAKATNETKEP
jgi:hypothetical protein